MKKLIVAMVLVAGVAAHAASFSYQGALRNADGSAITDLTKKIIFRIYETPDGGNALWVGQQTVAISPTNGLFNVEIGDGTPYYEAEMKQENRPLLDELFASSKDLYIGLDVYDTPNGLSGEIRPRQRILSVPTANYARNVSKAMRDFTVESNLVVKGTMNVKSDVTFSANATFKGAVKIEAKTTFTGDATFSGTLSAKTGNEKVAVEVMPVPIGGIIMWSQSSAPNGEKWATGAKDETSHWAICDGQNGTPDLRGCFIVGAGKSTEVGTAKDKNGNPIVRTAYAVGDAGGEEKHLLTTAEMPTHTHSFNRGRATNLSSTGSGTDIWARNGTYNAETDTTATGGSQLHENRPPYYALYYIMRVR